MLVEQRKLPVVESMATMKKLEERPEEFWKGVDTISFNPFKNFFLQKITIPKSVKFLDQAFKDNISLKRVKFESFAYVGALSFKNCKALEKVSGKFVTYIGEEAFSGCPNLKKVYLPNAKRIEKNAFRDDKNLEILDMPCVDYIGDGAFSGCPKLKVKCYPWQSVLFENVFDQKQLVQVTKEDVEAYRTLLKDNEIERKSRLGKEM